MSFHGSSGESHVLCHHACFRTKGIGQHPENFSVALTEGRKYLLKLPEKRIQCHLWTRSHGSEVSVRGGSM